MGIFNDVTIGFKGEEFTIEANKVMRLIASVEEVISLAELTTGKPKLAKIAEAYALMINYAGGNADIESVYESLFVNDGSQTVQAAIQSLIMLMLPPSSYSAPQETKKKDTALE